MCILPFPALLCISERRLRIAIIGIYSLAFIAIFISLSRAVIFTQMDPKHVGRIVEILTMVELATTNVIGCLPGISSLFTRKYVSTVSRETGAYRMDGFSQISNHSCPSKLAVTSYHLRANRETLAQPMEAVYQAGQPPLITLSAKELLRR